MKTFTIENETNNITLHASAKHAEAVSEAERFSNEAGLAKLAADWPASRLVEIWNSLPGETPVKRFKDRATAVSRIWKALQTLGQTTPVAEEAEEIPAGSPEAAVPDTGQVPEPEVSEEAHPEVAIPETAESDVATPVAPQTPPVAPEEAPTTKKATRAKKTPKANDGVPREGSKTSQVIEMLQREGGTTLEEIMTAMGWQKHTTRAMLSAGGSLAKKHRLVVSSERVGDHRRYSIKS